MDSLLQSPTEEGLRRYPDSAGFHKPDGDEERFPCTCKPECEKRCLGECGCEACHWVYQDFLNNGASARQ